MNYENEKKTISVGSINIPSSALISVANETNDYIIKLTGLFSQLNFDIFYSLGQRNISGFIGEIYKNILASKYKELMPNPHSDGSPDILLLDTQESVDYFVHDCFFETDNHRRIPKKDRLTPYLYGGIEVKCSIGSPDNKKYARATGHTFQLYEPRVGYNKGITWWAHHSNSSNLLGLYYDYYAKARNIPQIIAGFYSELTQDDWNAVSTGDPNHKKTSNTSLNKDGLSKMKGNCLFYCTDTEYVNQLKSINVTL